MLIYFALHSFILLLAALRHRRWQDYAVFLIIFLMLAFKGAVGCDYGGYFNHYLTFEYGKNIIDLRGEISWYYVEWLVHDLKLDYQWYYIFSAIIGTFFLLQANKYTKSLGLIAMIYPIVFVQLGLSGIRQFLAVCIVIYILSKYLFRHTKSLWPYVVFTLFAATFHVSALFMLIILPFVHKLKPIVVAGLFAVSFIAIGSSFADEVYSTYEFRYVADRSRVSSGAWIRYAFTVGILVMGTFYKNSKFLKLGALLIVLGLVIGLFNSIALHRMNYFLFPVGALLLLERTTREKKKLLLWTGYTLSLSYMAFWFLFSTHSDCLVPYHFFFQMGR